MNYKENIAIIKLKIVEEYAGDKKAKLMSELNLLLRYQRLAFIKMVEENLNRL